MYLFIYFINFTFLDFPIIITYVILVFQCYDNVEGRQCDRCKENKYDRQRGCVDCPACYNLVQTAVNTHRTKLQELEKVLNDIASNPTVINDEDFEKKLRDVQEIVEKLSDDAKHGTGSK